MLLKSIRLFSLLILFTSLVRAQNNFEFGTNITVLDDSGSALPMPFAGGINAAQIQKFDSNGNGTEELVIWDINAGNIQLYEKNGTTYNFLPGGAYYFPSDVNSFLVLIDFDGDGKKDLFTGSPFGIKAYRNITSPGNTLPVWEVAQNFLRLENGSNLTANILDIPLIEDIDKDGDLDILTFNFTSGDFLEYYQNTSMERKGSPDIDQFAASKNHWGNFEFCDCGHISFGFTCSGNPIPGFSEEADNLKVLHSGGHTLLYRDFDQDGTKDLLIGQDQCNTLYFLPNAGTDEAPVFSTFSTSTPEFGPLPQFPVFHAAFVLDDELIVSSHSSAASLIYTIDYGKALYRVSPGSDSSPSLFLKEEMLDFGENSRPFFIGNTFDGELFIAANRTIAGKVEGSVLAYELKDNQFSLITEDYLNISQLDLTEPGYQRFATKDNQSYHIITGDIYENNIPEKKIYISPVSSPDERSELILPDIVPRGLDQVHLFHDQVNNYLLLARQTGELLLYALNINGNIEAELLTRNFLGFIDNPVDRNLAVAVKSGEKPILMAINQRGVLYTAVDILQTENVLPVGIKLEDEIFPETRLGRNTVPTFVPHLLGEGFDLILGSSAGGLEYLNPIESGTTEPGTATEILLFPNPTNGKEFRIITNTASRLTIYGTTGVRILDNIALPANQENELNIPNLPAGLYLLEFITDENKTHYKKLMVTP